MQYHRGLIFWGLALVTGGAVALAAQQGYLNHDLMLQAWRLWPVILIATGLAVLLSRTRFAVVGTIAAALVVGAAGGAVIAVGPSVVSCGGPEPTHLTTRRGTFAADGRLDLQYNVKVEFNCGTLDVAMGKGPSWTVASAQRGGSSPLITSDPTHLEVRTDASSNWFDDFGGQQWKVTLPTGAADVLEISPNAAETHVDLSGGLFSSVSIHPNAGSLFLNLAKANVQHLDLEVNAGSASIVIGPSDQQTGFRSASMHVNAGSIDVCTVDGIALQVTADPNLTFATNLDESGLVHAGDSWSTAGYADAPDKFHISLEGNAGSFTLNPEEGCS